MRGSQRCHHKEIVAECKIIAYQVCYIPRRMTEVGQIFEQTQQHILQINNVTRREMKNEEMKRN